MRLLRRWLRRTGNFLTRRQDDERLKEEIAEHIAMQTAENMRTGMTAEEAKRNALLKFGAVEAMREDYRTERGLLFLETLLQDIRFAFRMLRKSPGFTAVAVLTLALGIGVNTAVFSAFDALVLRPFPVMQPDRLVDIYRSTPGEPEGRFSYPDYIYYRDHARSLSDLALFGFGSVVTSSDLPATGPGASPAIARAIGFHLPQLLQGSARPIMCFFVSGNYFSLLGARPFQGRILLPSDDLAAAQPVVMMSGNFWRHEFRSDPSVIGSTLHLNGQNFTVVGITPVDYVGTEPEVPDLWAPITARLHVDNLSAADLQNRSLVAGILLGRLKAGFLLADAQSEMNVLSAQLRTAHPTSEREMNVRVTSGRNSLASLDSTAWAIVLASMSAVALLLLIACANVASLLLARTVARRKEIAVRLALGASRSRLLRQLLTESTLLGLVAGAVGLAIANWGLRLLILQITSALPSFWGTIALQVSPDARIFAYTLLLSCAAGVAFGLTPALQASKADVNAAIKDEGSTLGRRLTRSRARQLLIGSQVTACVVLLITSTLLVRGSERALRIKPGFETQHVVYLEMYDPANLHYSRSRMLNLNRSLVQSIATIPGVKDVTRASRSPVGGTRLVQISSVDDASATSANDMRSIISGYSYVTPNYFETLSVPIIRGRDFTPRDSEAEAPVVIISEATAKCLWPHEDPVGKFLEIGSQKGSMSFPGESDPFIRKSEVIGIAGDVRSLDLRKTDDAYVYLPLAPNRQWTSVFLVRSGADPAPLLRLIGDQVRLADANLPVIAATLDTMVSMDPYFVISRVGGILASIIGLLGLALACMGVYGLISYSVVQRTREIGIRMALGAGKTQVQSLILRGAMIPVLIGMTVGIAASAGIARVLRSVLFGLSFLDPISFVGVSLFLVSVAAAASWFPARRAMRVDPMIALRHE